MGESCLWEARRSHRKVRLGHPESLESDAITFFSGQSPGRAGTGVHFQALFEPDIYARAFLEGRPPRQTRRAA
jgi:pyruvate dehydrogenase complex dehydrogenase (E1) component